MNELEDESDISDSERSEYSGLEAEDSTSEEDDKNSFLESDEEGQNVTKNGEVSIFRLAKNFLKVSTTIEASVTAFIENTNILDKFI